MSGGRVFEEEYWGGRILTRKTQNHSPTLYAHIAASTFVKQKLSCVETTHCSVSVFPI